MILIFDLDQTLLDTEKLKKDKSLIFGISPEENNLHSDLLFKKKGLHYNPETHLQFLIKSGHIKTKAEEDKIRAEYKKLIKEIDNYLFPEAEKTLAHLKKQGHRLILITLGDPSLQRSKVNNSRIKKYFEKIIYETKDKSQNESIKQLSGLKQDILIINDKASEALAMKKTLGEKTKIFLVKGLNSQNVKHKEKINDNIFGLREIS